MRLIVGGDSYIGSALYDLWSQEGVACKASTRKELLCPSNRLLIDLEKRIWPARLEDYSVAIFCAGISDVSVCENHVEYSRKINVEGVLALVGELARNGTSLYLLSSTQVFDGVEPFLKTTAKLSPVTEYGRQKAQVESVLLNSPRGYTIRITKVINEGSSLIKNWRTDLENHIPIYPFADIYIAPVSVNKVVREISSIVSKTSGKRVHHISGKNEISYAKLASRLCKKWGCDESLINPISAEQECINLPTHSSLSTE